MKVRRVAAALSLPLAFVCLLHGLPAAARAAGSCAAPSFNRAPALSENFVNYKAVAFADFNGDGKTDMAAGTLGSGFSGTVKVYLGDGAGAFGAPATFQTGDTNAAWDVAAGDFNKDGKVDLVAANNFSNSVSLLLGNGSGGFGNGIMFDVGGSPRSLAVADFNRDGSPDLATANFFSGSVTVLLGDGAGSLGNAKTVNVVASPQYIRTADFNNDNKPDLVVSSQNVNGVTVLLGDGAGNFAAAGPSFGPTNRSPLGVAAGDFDGDGAVDLAVVGGTASNDVSIWRGDNAGHFTVQGTVGAGLNPRFVVASDFDGDGRLDLLVTNADGNNVSLLRGTGGGSFASQRVFVAGTTQPLYAAAADLNGDQKSDAVVVNILDLAVMLSDGAGGLLASEAFPLSSAYNSGAVGMAEGDFNADGKPDVAVAGDRLYVLRNVGNGRLQVGFSGPVGPASQFGAVAAGDFDRDGKLDVAATGGAGGGQLTVFHGDGAGGFPRTSVTRIDSATAWLQVADFNNDGSDDLVTPLTGSSPVSVFLNDGTGSFTRKIVPGFGVQIKTVAVGDFNGDGNADLVGQKPFSNPTFADVAVFLGDGAGNFNQSPNGLYTTSGFPDALLADDFNGDGKTDLLVSVSTGINSTSGIFLLAGDGAGGLGGATKISDLSANSLTTGDFNADGNIDLAATAEDIAFVLQGDGAGTFSTPFRFPVGRAPRKVVAADFNGDGKRDMATANGPGEVAVLLNTCSFVPDPLPSLSVSDASVNEGDGGTVNATFTVQLSAASTKTVGVSFYAFPSGASAGDLQPSSGRLLFAPGVTSRTFTVAVTGDTTDEFDEKFGVRLVYPANAAVARAQGEGTIVDNDPPPSASVGDANVNEGNAGSNNLAVFTVTLSAPSAKPITLSYATAAGTAAAGTDFQSATGTVTFSPGETAKNVGVNVVGDGAFEADETFFVNLGDPSNVTVADGQGVGTLVNDDAGVRFNSATQTTNEGAGSVQIVVKRVGSLTGSSTAAYSTADGTASERSDYNLALGTLTFGPGETEKSFTVFVTDDRYAEGSETFNVTLNAVDGASTDTPSTLTVTIQDNDSANGTSPVRWEATFDPSFFVRQHYLDFLNREPDASGLAFWTDQMTNCGNSNVEVCRVNVSAAFFLSIEFQQTGYLVYKTYKAAYGDLAPDKPVPVRLREFAADTQALGRGVQVGAPDWEARLEANKRAYFDAFAATQRFAAQYPASLTAAQFVDRLNTNTGNVLTQSERDGLVADLASGAKTRAQVLRAVAESTALHQREFNRAFVLMQYFGYLRRDPDSGNDTDFTGYLFWLGKLNEFNGNFVQAEMVKAFLQSDEYVKRFGQ